MAFPVQLRLIACWRMEVELRRGFRAFGSDSGETDDGGGGFGHGYGAALAGSSITDDTNLQGTATGEIGVAPLSHREHN